MTNPMRSVRHCDDLTLGCGRPSGRPDFTGTSQRMGAVGLNSKRGRSGCGLVFRTFMNDEQEREFEWDLPYGEARFVITGMVGAIQSDAAMLSIRESREAWHMAAAKLSDEAFSAILEAHPGLRERFASIAMAVANSGENLKEADAIEERIVEEMRLLGREAMQGWAETQVKATEKEIRQQPSMHRQGKKNSAGIRNLAKSKF